MDYKWHPNTCVINGRGFVHKDDMQKIYEILGDPRDSVSMAFNPETGLVEPVVKSQSQDN